MFLTVPMSVPIVPLFAILYLRFYVFLRFGARWSLYLSEAVFRKSLERYSQRYNFEGVFWGERYSQIAEFYQKRCMTPA